jgi:hypothetical protein
MNLWVNRLRQLTLLLSVALFFFGCEDESSLLGFKNPNPKFKGQYVDLELSSSVLLLDSIRTSNAYFTNEFNRLLVGKYTDPEIGVVKSNAAAQFLIGNSDTIAYDAAGLQLDAVYLHLHLDLYHYGSKATSPQQISVYPLTEILDRHDKLRHTGNKPVLYNSGELLADTTFNVNPGLYDEIREAIASGVNDDNDQTNNVDPVILKIKLDDEYGQRLWSELINYSKNHETDTTLLYDSLFAREFPGLAFVSGSESNDKILGISLGTSSRIVMRYRTAEKDSLERSFYFFPGLSNYSNLQIAEKSANIASLQPWIDQELDGKRYLQTGTGLMTKVDLSNFYQFASQDSVSNILINSAELVIDDVVAGDYAVPSGISMRVLKSNNRLARQSAEQLDDDRHFALWTGVLSADMFIGTSSGQVVQRPIAENDSTLQALTDGTSGVALTYSSSNEKYSGFLSLFFQRLYKNRNEEVKYTNFVLYPTDVSNAGLSAKSLSRAVFNADKVRLRIFYTKPTINN